MNQHDSSFQLTMIVVAVAVVFVIITSFIVKLCVKEFHSFMRTRVGKKREEGTAHLQANKLIIFCMYHTDISLIYSKYNVFLWQRQKAAHNNFECGGSISFISFSPVPFLSLVLFCTCFDPFCLHLYILFFFSSYKSLACCSSNIVV